MKDTIAARLNLNIARVKSLIQIYDTHLSGTGSGRRNHKASDVLRAATVLLHASVEDLLRSLAYWKLPVATAKALDQFPLSTAAPAMKYSLGALAAHRGKTVDEVIKESVDAYLERSNYNNTAEVATLLGHVDINVTAVNHTFQLLEELMRRRHQIVHRADQNETGGQGNHRVRSLGTGTVNNWVANVEAFSSAILAQV